MFGAKQNFNVIFHNIPYNTNKICGKPKFYSLIVYPSDLMLLSIKPGNIYFNVTSLSKT